MSSAERSRGWFQYGKSAVNPGVSLPTVGYREIRLVLVKKDIVV